MPRCDRYSPSPLRSRSHSPPRRDRHRRDRSLERSQSRHRGSRSRERDRGRRERVSANTSHLYFVIVCGVFDNRSGSWAPTVPSESCLLSVSNDDIVNKKSLHDMATNCFGWDGTYQPALYAKLPLADVYTELTVDSAHNWLNWAWGKKTTTPVRAREYRVVARACRHARTHTCAHTIHTTRCIHTTW